VDTVHDVKEVYLPVGASGPDDGDAILLELAEAFMNCPVERHLLFKSSAMTLAIKGNDAELHSHTLCLFIKLAAEAEVSRG
jgi:hypothetical protein